MICPECNGKGETIYYVETDRDENSVTVERRKGICRTCNGSGEKPQTNADRIRAMSDEEMAKFIGHNSLCDQIQNDNGAWCKKQSVCEGCLVEWLKQPAEGGSK